MFQVLKSEVLTHVKNEATHRTEHDTNMTHRLEHLSTLLTCLSLNDFFHFDILAGQVSLRAKNELPSLLCSVSILTETLGSQALEVKQVKQS